MKKKHKSERKSIVAPTNRKRLGNIILFYFKQIIKSSHLTEEKKTIYQTSMIRKKIHTAIPKKKNINLSSRFDVSHRRNYERGIYRYNVLKWKLNKKKITKELTRSEENEKPFLIL